VGFEIYKRQRAPATTDPSITIQKRGTLSLNVAAFTALDSPDAVELLYDRDHRLMALRKVDPGAAHAYQVRALGRGAVNSTWLISGMAFTAHYGIPTEVARRWIGRVEDGMLILDLATPGAEVTAGQRRKPNEALTN
jgi:hypothetical protein